MLHLLLLIVVSWETVACKILKHSGGRSESVLRTLCSAQASAVNNLLFLQEYLFGSAAEILLKGGV